MEITLIVLGIGVVALGGLAVWLGHRLGRVGGELAGTQAIAADQKADHDQQIAELRSGHDHEQSMLKAELADTREQANETTSRLAQQSELNARLGERLENAAKIQQELDKNETRLKEAFGALSAKALQDGRAEFLAQAKPVFEAAKKEQSDLVKPIGDVLSATREKLEAIEKSRVESFARLHENIEMVSGASVDLRTETAKLAKALSKPEIRGQYGEIQLRRVAELAGMINYCDFTEQMPVRDSEGKLQKPDMVVKLPNKRIIVVDAKTNILAYLDAIDAETNAERDQHLDRFAVHIHEQAKQLSKKEYWSQFDGSPEFVVMFVPGDNFIDAALSRKPELLDYAAQHRVILASPTTLIGLLRAVAVGWREEKLAKRANDLFDLGKQLHDRAAIAFGHAAILGKSLDKAVENYNKFAGSVDTNLIRTLREFEQYDVKGTKDLPDLRKIESRTRLLNSAPTDALDATSDQSPSSRLAD